MTYKYVFECAMIYGNEHIFVHCGIITHVDDPVTRNVDAWDRAYKSFRKCANDHGLKIGQITMYERET